MGRSEQLSRADNALMRRLLGIYVSLPKIPSSPSIVESWFRRFQLNELDRRLAR